MQHFRFILVALCTILFIACSTSPSKYTLTGKFAEQEENIHEGQTIYLVEGDLSEPNRIDSCVVANNTFSFTKEIKGHQKLGFIEHNPQSWPLMYVQEEGNILVEISENGYKIGGTTKNNSYQQYLDSLDSLLMGSAKFIEQMQELNNNEELTLEKFKEAETEINTYIEILEKHVVDFIVAEQKSPLAYYVFDQDTYFLKAKNLNHLVTLLFSDDESAKASKIKAYAEAMRNRDVGKKILETKGVNLKGDSVMLSSLITKNELTLIDFWASWCGPCRQVTPILQNILKKHESQGLGILGFSLDESEKAWHTASEEDSITWDQIATLNADEIYKKYGIRGIPHWIIVDKDGVIKDNNVILDELFLDIKIKSLLQ